MNNLAKNLTDRLGQPYKGKTIPLGGFDEKDIVTISCREHGFKSVHAISTPHKAIKDLIETFRKEIEEEFNMPYDVAIDMEQSQFLFNVVSFQDRLFQIDAKCHENQINDQIDLNDKKQSKLNDKIVELLVLKYVVLNMPLNIIGLASNWHEVERSKIKLVN